jgi:hypothetical protein
MDIRRRESQPLLIGSRPLLCLATAQLITAGCAAVTHPYSLEPVRDSASRTELIRHAVFVDNNGNGIDPRVNKRGRTLDSAGYARYVHGIMDGIRSHRDSGHPDVLIRIHGGLNSLRGAPTTSVRMNTAIRNDTAKQIYPLFINWDSGILESYGEHLFYVRQGRRKSLDLVGAPFHLVADFGRAITRLPIVWVGQVRRTNACLGTQNVPPRPDTAPQIRLSPRDSALKAYLDMNDCGITGAFENDLFSFEDSLRQPRPGFPADTARIPVVSRFAYRRSVGGIVAYTAPSMVLSMVPIRTLWAFRDLRTKHHGSIWAPIIERHPTHTHGKIGRSVINALSWLPPKVAALMMLDAVGTPAWANMRRRTKTMFQQPYAANDFSNAAPKRPRPGAVAILFDSLETMQRVEMAERKQGSRITLIGHSMGAIIANEALRTHDSLEVANVVYMAPALSLRDFQVGTLPYLRRHESSQFYNLTLHPLSDLREANFLNLAPYGSLISWLDAYLDHPESELDRMMGSYQNSTESAGSITGPVRTRMHLKAFGYGDRTGCGPNGLPYRHGDFNEPGVPFWDPRFWRPGAHCPDSASAPRLVQNSGAR